VIDDIEQRTKRRVKIESAQLTECLCLLEPERISRRPVGIDKGMTTADCGNDTQIEMMICTPDRIRNG
jgi:hypothetical protein